MNYPAASGGVSNYFAPKRRKRRGIKPMLRNKVVKSFIHGCSVIDSPSEIGFAHVLEQIGAANNFPQFLEGVK